MTTPGRRARRAAGMRGIPVRVDFPTSDFENVKLAAAHVGMPLAQFIAEAARMRAARAAMEHSNEYTLIELSERVAELEAALRRSERLRKCLGETTEKGAIK